MFSKVGKSNKMFAKQTFAPSMFSKISDPASSGELLQNVGSFIAKKRNDLEKYSSKHDEPKEHRHFR